MTLGLCKNKYANSVKMNIIIPIGGKGERFSKNGYTEPKPLIPIFEKCMIEYVLDCIQTEQEDQIYIIYNTELDRHHFASKILVKHPRVRFIGIDKQTRGAAETLLLGIQSIKASAIEASAIEASDRKKCLILDCDTFYTEDIVGQFRESNENMVFYTKTGDPNPIYSYIELDAVNRIVDIKEKIRISDNANTGAYAFKDMNVLLSYCHYVVDTGIVANGEPYTSCVISEMLKDGHVFLGRMLNKEQVFSLGTPESVKSYVERTHAFLFDLDGTLVITDTGYYYAWTQILANYNIVLTRELFSKFIQGNNDRYVLNSLLVSTGLSLAELSEWKDRLFLQHVDKIGVVGGAKRAICQIREAGHKLCIVTNCNRIVAEAILRKIGILEQFDFIMSSDDFSAKSYKLAAEKYGIAPNKCFVFEDSKTGILCGKRFAPKALIGIETVYNGEELSRYGVDVSMPDYTQFDINTLLNASNDPLKQIRTSLRAIFNTSEITVDDAKLKGGFIADVIKARTGSTHLIVKYECGNQCQTGLSQMAKRIRMYEREYYFYESIAPTINVRIPKFHGFVKDEHGVKNGIVLENMFERSHRLNLNLNTESIDVALKVVDQMAKLHSAYWGKPLKQRFRGLYSYSDELFSPFLNEFVEERREAFMVRWSNVLTSRQQSISNEIFDQYSQIQRRFSCGNNLTFIHGDIKSPNLFYGPDNEPVFIDWQHCAIGKGVQDLAFFVLESFDMANIREVFQLTKRYYYMKLKEYGVEGYSPEEYECDLNDALRFIPFMTAVWFGTTPQDELIDPNFPYFLITKLFYLLATE